MFDLRRAGPPDDYVGWMHRILDAELDPDQWDRPDPQPTAPFVLVESRTCARLDQGWKVHVSSYAATATETLRCALPILIEARVTFKIVADPARLRTLNEGRGGRSQIGKFITVYPQTTERAVEIAQELARATGHMRAPAIPSDRRLGGTPVHYRYGVFWGRRRMQTKLGEVHSALVAPDGSLVPDRRLAVYRQPTWVEDPFISTDPALRPLDLGGWQDSTGRYVAVSTIQESDRRIVELGLDVRELRPCVIKRRAPWAPDLPAESDEQLRRERMVYRRVAGCVGIAGEADLVADGDAVALVLEDLAGESLDFAIRRLYASGEPPDSDRIAAWGSELAGILANLHRVGYVHGDVKTGNVLLGGDGALRLVDFELSVPIGSDALPRGAGTRGYMSPHRSAGAPADPRDDIFGLGAVLYAAATGAEPSRAPNPERLLDRPVRLLNPSIRGTLAAIIERCLAVDSRDRFASAEAVARSLALDAGAVPVAAAPAEHAVDAPTDSFAASARRAGDALCEAAERTPDGGLVWRSHATSGHGEVLHDINAGMAGTLLALTEIAIAFQDPGHLATLHEGAATLARLDPLPGPFRPGLYIGDAGIGVALLRAALAVGDDSIVDAGLARVRGVASAPFDSPDLFQGTAGRLVAHLIAWDHTGEANDLRAAVAAGDDLLAARELDARCAAWTIPDGYDGLSGKRYLGYAHGAAGIGDALLALAVATGDQRYLAGAQSAARLIEREARPALSEGQALTWPAVPGGASYPPFWCHGAAGIGGFLLRLARAGSEPRYGDLAGRASRMVAQASLWAGPTLCHGLAGNVDFLLDAAGDLDDLGASPWVQDLVRSLGAFARPGSAGAGWATDDSGEFSPDYLVGSAGIAMTMLRLAKVERVRPLRPLGPAPAVTSRAVGG